MELHAKPAQAGKPAVAGKLVGEALDLEREYHAVLTRLPRTFLVSNLIELKKWQTLFDAERAYFRELMKLLGVLSGPEFDKVFGSLNRFEARTGCDAIPEGSPEDFQARALAHLQRSGSYSAWRAEIQKVFDVIEPRVESRLYSGERGPRVVMVLYGEGIAIEREKMWQRFRQAAVSLPLDLQGAENSAPFLEALFTGLPVSRREGQASSPSDAIPPTLFHLRRESQNVSPLDQWIIEAGSGLHALCEGPSGKVAASPCATGLSYDRLRAYRERLSDTIDSKVRSGVRGPLELAAFLGTLQVKPQEGVSLFYDEVVLNFIRDIFLAGSGTLIINNTFVEWGAIQALKRAQPRFLVARFGVRDKMKPFSSLLLFSKPRPTDQIPNLQDPLGSFVDVELLSYYIWLNAEKGPPYRDNTLYLLLAEGVDEMLAVRPSSWTKPPASPALATLADVAATVAHHLGVELPGSSGRLIPSLLA